MSGVPKSRTKRTPEQQAEHNQRSIGEFDSMYPVGTTVWYWTALPFGPVRETKIKHGAWALGSGDLVCKVEGVSGGVSIWHIQQVDESRRSEIKFIEA